MSISIVADHREPPIIIEILRKLDVDVKIEQLQLGDYIISDDLVVERKTGRDFVQSLYDNRLFEQAHRLIDAYEQVIYILEGFDIERHEYKPVFGALSYLMIRRGISFLPSYDHDQTASLIERIGSWTQEEHKDPILARIGPKRMSKEEKQIFLLEGLEGVGDKTAKLLLEEVGSPIKVFSAIQNSKILYTRTGNPKGITGVLKDVRGIGYKFVEKNKKVLGLDK